MGTFASWNSDPSKIPEAVLFTYRVAARGFALHTWLQIPSNAGVVSSWKAQNSDANTADLFYRFVYPIAFTKKDETIIARSLFQGDYATHIKPGFDKNAAETAKAMTVKKQQLDGACSPHLFRETVPNPLRTAYEITSRNFEASKAESGVIETAVRAITGVSIFSMMEFGARGGKNSELNKQYAEYEAALDKGGLSQSTVAGKALRAAFPIPNNLFMPPYVADDKRFEPPSSLNPNPNPNPIPNPGHRPSAVEVMSGGILH